MRSIFASSSVSDSDLDLESAPLAEPEEMVTYVSALFYGFGGIVVAGVALLVAFQEKLVYVPVLPGLSKSYPITPARLNLIYEDIWLQSSDGVRLHAWFIKMFPECRGPHSLWSLSLLSIQFFFPGRFDFTFSNKLLNLLNFEGF